MNIFAIAFALTIIIDVILAFAGKEEYRENRAEITRFKHSYPFRSLMFLGYGFIRFFYKPGNTDNKIHRMYLCRYRSEEKAEQKMRAFTAHIITLAAALLTVFFMLSAISFSRSHKTSEAAMIASVGVLGAVSSGIICKKREADASEKRNALIVSELPVVMNKIIVRLESGATMSVILTELGDRAKTDPNPLYEELEKVKIDLHNNLGLARALTDMQKRCMSPAVTRFVNVLVQNITKGTSDCAEELEMIAREMWGEKKSNDIIRCKSKKTKLTLPTLLVFGAVLAMMMYPALKKVLETKGGENGYVAYDPSYSDTDSSERSYSVLRTGSES
jgi:tight adherence protein C